MSSRHLWAGVRRERPQKSERRNSSWSEGLSLSAEPVLVSARRGQGEGLPSVCSEHLLSVACKGRSGDMICLLLCGSQRWFCCQGVLPSTATGQIRTGLLKLSKEGRGEKKDGGKGKNQREGMQGKAFSTDTPQLHRAMQVTIGHHSALGGHT